MVSAESAWAHAGGPCDLGYGGQHALIILMRTSSRHLGKYCSKTLETIYIYVCVYVDWIIYVYLLCFMVMKA